MSMLSNCYGQIYAVLCGRSPSVLFRHVQWLALAYLTSDIRRELPSFGGRVLDVGSGDKPYRPWVVDGQDYVGLDIVAER